MMPRRDSCSLVAIRKSILKMSLTSFYFFIIIKKAKLFILIKLKENHNMVAPLIAALIGAGVSLLIAELVKRPLGELFEGLILTEEAPVRTAMSMYVLGAVDKSYFVRVMNKHNVEPVDQSAYLAYADLRLANKAEDERLAQLKVYNNYLEKLNKVYDSLEEDADDKELDELVQVNKDELNAFEDFNKGELNAFEQNVKDQIVDLDLTRDAIRTLLTAAVKKGEELPILNAIEGVNSEIAALNKTVVDKRAAGNSSISKKRAEIIKNISDKRALLNKAVFDKRGILLTRKRSRVDAEFVEAGKFNPGPAVEPPLPWCPVPEGGLSVSTTPGGADVLINNVVKGQTAITIPLAPGTYNMTLRKSGYLDTVMSIIIESGKTTSFNITLTPSGPPPYTEREKPANVDNYITFNPDVDSHEISGGVFNTPVPFSASYDEKAAAAADFRTEPSYAAWPINTEMIKVKLKWVGPFTPTQDIIVNFKWYNDDTGQLLYNDDWTIPKTPPAPSTYWLYYEIASMIGKEHTGTLEVNGPGIYRVDVTADDGSYWKSNHKRYYKVKP